MLLQSGVYQYPMFLHLFPTACKRFTISHHKRKWSWVYIRHIFYYMYVLRSNIACVCYYCICTVADLRFYSKRFLLPQIWTKKEHHSKYTFFPDNLYLVLTVGCSGIKKGNALLKSINFDHATEKTCLNCKDKTKHQPKY